MKPIAILIASVLLATPVLATTIETGMWGIEEEFNGKPGRGLQIDHQGGDTMAVTYFGYRTDGTALFLQASGKQVNQVFEADLVEYQGGTVLGGPASDGRAAATVGTVRLEFSGPTTGTVVLPGEAPKPVRRMRVENHAERFDKRTFLGTSFPVPGMAFAGQSGAPVPQSFTFALDGETFRLTTTSSPPIGASTTCEFNGDLRQAGSGFISTGNAVCTGAAPGDYVYRTGVLKVSQDGIYSGEIWQLAGDQRWALRENHAAVCSAAVIGNAALRCAPASTTPPTPAPGTKQITTVASPIVDAQGRKLYGINLNPFLIDPYHNLAIAAGYPDAKNLTESTAPYDFHPPAIRYIADMLARRYGFEVEGMFSFSSVGLQAYLSPAAAAALLAEELVTGMQEYQSSGAVFSLLPGSAQAALSRGG